MPMPRAVRTKNGQTLTGRHLDELVAKAEEGYDLAGWTPRRGRPSLDAASKEPSPRIAVRLPPNLHRRVSSRAAGEGRTVSEVVRELLADYAGRGR